MIRVVKGMREYVASELLIAIISSTFPLVYLFLSAGSVEEFGANLKSFITQGFLLKYTFWLLIVYVTVFFVRLGYRRKSFEFLYKVFSQLGSGVINIYRLATGALIAVPIVWYIESPETITLREAAFFLIFIPVFWGFCCFLSSANHEMNEKFNKQSQATLKSARLL